MASFPELLDVGIMGNCRHGQSGLCIKAGVRTNIHYVLNKSTVHEAVERLKAHGFPKGINAIVFLLHKPVGLGKKENIITAGHREFQRLLRLAVSGKTAYKIGFDSCTVPALINIGDDIAENSLDTCEDARWSAYISSDMKMMPCSFDNQEMRWAVDLKEYTIREAWNSAEFEEFRDHFRTACHGCENQRLCMGGCPIRPEIVICKKKAAQI